MLRLIVIGFLIGCAGVGIGAERAQVTFSVATPEGTPQSCRVNIFREIYRRKDEFSNLFKGCKANAIPHGTYEFDLGENRKGVLVVNGAKVLKIIEDVDVPKGFAITLSPPTEVARTLEGIAPLEADNLRLRIFNL